MSEFVPVQEKLPFIGSWSAVIAGVIADAGILFANFSDNGFTQNPSGRIITDVTCAALLCGLRKMEEERWEDQQAAHQRHPSAGVAPQAAIVQNHAGLYRPMAGA